MVVPLTPRGAEGGEVAPYGHAARLAAHASRCSFLAAQPGHLTLVSARPAPSLPCHSRPSAAAGHGQIVYRGSEQESNLSPVLPRWKGNSREFSNFLLCSFKDYSMPAWGHQGKVLKVPKGISF